MNGIILALALSLWGVMPLAFGGSGGGWSVVSALTPELHFQDEGRGIDRTARAPLIGDDALKQDGACQRLLQPVQRDCEMVRVSTPRKKRAPADTAKTFQARESAGHARERIGVFARPCRRAAYSYIYCGTRADVRQLQIASDHAFIMRDAGVIGERFNNNPGPLLSMKLLPREGIGFTRGVGAALRLSPRVPGENYSGPQADQTEGADTDLSPRSHRHPLLRPEIGGTLIGLGIGALALALGLILGGVLFQRERGKDGCADPEAIERDR